MLKLDQSEITPIPTTKIVCNSGKYVVPLDVIYLFVELGNLAFTASGKHSLNSLDQELHRKTRKSYTLISKG